MSITTLDPVERMLDNVEQDSKLGNYIAKKLREKHRLSKLIKFEKVKNSLRKKYEDFLIFYNNFLMDDDKQRVFDIKLPLSDYNIISYRQRMNRLYPMISHGSCYRWSFDEDMAKALVHYIKIVDEHTEQNNIFLQAEKIKDAGLENKNIV